MKKVIAILAVVAFVASAAFAADTAKPAASTEPAASAAPAVVANPVVTGKIVEFTADKSKKTAGTLVVVDSAKKKASIVVATGTTITVGKKAGTVKDLAKNKTVSVEYTAAGKVLTAVSITL